MLFRACVLGITMLVMLQVPAPVHAQESDALREIEQLGASLHQIDRAVRVAAREGEKSRAFRRDERVQGWVADIRSDAISIVFVGVDGGVPVGLYRIAMDRSGRVMQALERIDPAPLQGHLATQYSIGRKAEGVERMQCANEIETLVLPDAEGWRAYVLPRAAFPDVYLLGGSYRVELSSSGDAVTGVQALASECVILQNKPASGALLFAEDRGTTPNELHVYISRLAGKPLYVTTTPNGRTWLIQDGRIQGVDGIPATAG